MASSPTAATAAIGKATKLAGLTGAATAASALSLVAYHGEREQRRAALAQALAEDRAMRERERLARAQRRLLALSEAQLRKNGLEQLLVRAWKWSSRTLRMVRGWSDRPRRAAPRRAKTSRIAMR